MTTAYTSLLGLALPVTGELSGTWGSVVNDSITSLVDTSVAGTTNVSTDANVTLTTTTGASNQARQAILLFSGARTAIRTVTAPAQSKIYTVINATTGGFAVTLVGAGPTTGVTIANGARTVVAWNGSDFVEVSSPSSIILPGGTANGVLYLNGSKVVTSGSALVFDGTNLGVGTASPASGSITNARGSGVAASIEIAGNGATAGSTSFSLIQASESTVYIYNRANTAMIFGTNNTERMRLDAAGNLGLGVTPSAWGTITALQVKNAFVGGLTNNAYFGANAYYNGTNYIYQASSFASLYFQSSSAHQWFTAPSGTAGNAITFTQAMTLNSGGYLGIGTTSPSARVHAVGSGVDQAEIQAENTSTTSGARALVRVKSASSTYGGGLMMSNATDATYPTSSLLLYNFDSQPLVFGTNNAERARIDSSGNFLMNVTSGVGGTPPDAGHIFETNGNAKIRTNGDNSYFQFYNSSGTQVGSIATNGSITLYNTSSDYRLKTVVGAVTGSGARIDALEPIEYEWNSNGSRTRGFLAHKFQEVYADSVTGIKDAVDAEGNPVYQAMQAGSSEVIADLVAEIKSLRKRLADAGIA